MADSIAQLEPTALWERFHSLTQVPRPSKREEKVRAWARAWAAEHDYEILSDAIGNIVVRVPASPGREAAPTVVLQSHLDMVCEKNRGVEHDFDEEPIRTEIRDGWVGAIGTTLGADNGIGVAASMAAATSPDCTHGPLELLFTTDEETGLTGAAQLDASIVQGRLLLNLDTEEDNVICIGCAGGADTILELPLQRGDGTSNTALELRGLRGGHSGMNIHENRGNAIQLLARILRRAQREGLIDRVAAIDGGDKSNAIPREARALFHRAGNDAGWNAFLAKARSTLATELAGIEEGVTLEVVDAEATTLLDDASSDRLLSLLVALPHGVLGMSQTLEDLVETSSNLAAVHCSSGSARIVTSSRSSLAPALEGVCATIRAAAELAGASWSESDAYPGWQPNPDSTLTATLKEVFETLWNVPPKVEAVHAGLECGLLGERIDGLDMVSFGPTITGAHSPDEQVHIEAVAKFWKTLTAALDRLSR